jgi:hypothetical protein
VSESPFPRLDLAPKLNRPLRLWWPPDYLRLLYWAFFFPQAIRWYILHLSKSGRDIGDEAAPVREFWNLLRNDPIQGRLVVQALVCALAAAVFLAGALDMFWLPISWGGFAVGVGGAIIGSVLAGVTRGIAAGLAFGVAGIVTGGIAAGVAVAQANTVVDEFGAAVALFVAGGIALSIAANPAGCASKGVARGIVRMVTISLWFGIGGGIASALTFGIAVGLLVIVAVSVATTRLLDWLISCLASSLYPAQILIRTQSRVTWLPLPGIQRTVKAWLVRDWLAGVSNAKELLTYTRQFIPVLNAVNAVLEMSSNDKLLARVAALTQQPIHWDLLRFGSVDLSRRFYWDTIGKPSWYPREWRRSALVGSSDSPRLDTPAHAACAGFWLWHRKRIDLAVEAFAVVQNLRHGQELHGIAHAIAAAQAAGDLEAMMAFAAASAWLEALPAPELRAGTLAALRVLRQVAEEARVARLSVSALSRSAALGRANAVLTRLIEMGGETCPEPEWPLIRNSAEKWRDIISKAGGVVGEEVLRQPVPNPYEGYSGLPVTGATFVGRVNILRHIGDRWAGGAQPPPLIIFGHRRMGKSSVLRNLNRIADTHTIVVYLDMQDAGWVDHTGELLLDFAEAIHRRLMEAGLDAGQSPVEADYADLGTARRSLNALLDRLDRQLTGRRLILAVDEYEVIEEGITKGRIDSDIPRYLRSKAAEYRWLVLIFAGLHTLDEMGRDYRSAFYGQAEHIRVGYLSHNDTIRLITQPHPDFALEYALDLREELYRLTYGQPYLLQRLCWELVNNWNERFLREGEFTPRTLTMDDLAPVLTFDFYQAAGYYFDGVWTNVTNAERQLMRVIAGRAEGAWTPTELSAAAGLPEDTVRASLELLRRHDVIVDEAGGVRFAAELMRRWVTEYGGVS